MKHVSLPLGIAMLVLSVLACGGSRTPSNAEATRQAVFQNLYPSPTSEATQTPSVRVITTTPLPTTTPMIVVYTATPVPTTQTKASWLCVTAVEAVNLRPSPSTENHIAVLKYGQKVIDLGGRDGSWLYVQVGDSRGWVNIKYLGNCDK